MKINVAVLFDQVIISSAIDSVLLGRTLSYEELAKILK